MAGKPYDIEKELRDALLDAWRNAPSSPSEEQLKQYVEATVLPALLKHQRRWVSKMSHDLNNPLGAILGFTQLLLSGTLTAQQHHDVETIHKQAARCRELVQELNKEFGLTAPASKNRPA